MFEYSFVPSGGTHRPLLVVGASVGEALFVGIVALAPLFFVQSLPERGFLSAIMLPTVPLAPPPPPAPVLVAKHTPRARAPRMFNPNALVSPVVVPKVVAMIEEAPALEIETVAGGVPGGIPAAAVGFGAGFSNGLSLAPPPPPPPPKIVEAAPPPPPALPRRIKIGGDVQAGLLLQEIPPVYPSPARQRNISGTVILAAVIGTDGKIKNLTAVSGHPLLVAAAMKVVPRWVYRPTVLNGAPVEVITQIELHFNLGA